MLINAIAEIIRKRIGIIADSIGLSSIERAVKTRMSSCGERDIEAYLSRVTLSQEELQQLINEVTVPETWFFRDQVPFTLLSDYINHAWLPNKQGACLRILSIPCSTGEEPYSIAITLLESGLTINEFHIDAIDINTRVLEMAKRGVYGKNSFREKVDPDESPFFEKVQSDYRVTDLVRSSVSFNHGNILDSGVLSGMKPYNIVFCRNLLIYFDLDTKNHAINNLHRLLADDGLLFLGHAETGRVAQGLFTAIRHPGAFAYQKLSPLDTGFSMMIEKKLMSAKQNKLARRVSPEVKPVQPENSRLNMDHSPESEPVAVIDTLQKIQQLADVGNLDDAFVECQKYIRRSPDDSEGYYLMGIIALAKDNDREAEDWLRKTIYLDPRHYEALIQLAILAEEQGNTTGARNYRARAERVKSA